MGLGSARASLMCSSGSFPAGPNELGLNLYDVGFHLKKLLETRPSSFSVHSTRP